MTAVDYAEEARECVLIIGGGRPAGQTYEAMIWTAAQRSGLPFKRTWAYFYRRVKRPPADEMDALRAARDRQRALMIERLGQQKLDDEWMSAMNAFERLQQG